MALGGSKVQTPRPARQRRSGLQAVAAAQKRAPRKALGRTPRQLPWRLPRLRRNQRLYHCGEGVCACRIMQGMRLPRRARECTEVGLHAGSFVPKGPHPKAQTKNEKENKRTAWRQNVRKGCKHPHCGSKPGVSGRQERACGRWHRWTGAGDRGGLHQRRLVPAVRGRGHASCGPDLTPHPR